MPETSTQGQSARPVEPVTDRDTVAGASAPSRRLPWRGVFWLVGFAAVIGVAHYFLIAPEFSYLGFQRDDLDAPTVAALLASYVVCARRLPQSWERPSAMIYWTLFLLVVTPIHVVPAFQTTRTAATWTMIVSVAAAFWLLGLIYSYRAPVISRPSLPRKIYWFCFGIAATGLLGLVIATYGFELSLVSLSEVYDVRDEFKETAEDVPAVAQYAITWLGSVFAPIAVARGMLIKNYVWIVAGCFTELLLVSITGYKSLLFSSVMVFGIFMLVRKADLTRVGTRAAVAITGCVVAVVGIDVLTNGITMSALFIRRLILTAGVNTSYYFEYFAEFPKAGLGHSVLAPIVQYPYELPPANHIGLVYYGDPETAANANLWADAFSNFGLWGVGVFTLILAAVMVLVDGICAGLPRGLALISFAMPAVSLSNSAMLTVFVTHGMLLTLLLMALMPEEARRVGPLAHVGRARPSVPQDRSRRPVVTGQAGVGEDAPSRGGFAAPDERAEPAASETSDGAPGHAEPTGTAEPTETAEPGTSGSVGGRRRRAGPPVEGTPDEAPDSASGTDEPGTTHRPGRRMLIVDGDETTETTERES